MPQFVVIAKDQPGALERRMATRPEHLEKIAAAAERGEEIIGGALLDDNGEMCGSMLVFDVESRARVDELIAADPFTRDQVWGEVNVMPLKIAPVFAHLLKVKGS
jgi:uncharacterized protein YciI